MEAELETDMELETVLEAVGAELETVGAELEAVEAELELAEAVEMELEAEMEAVEAGLEAMGEPELVNTSGGTGYRLLCAAVIPAAGRAAGCGIRRGGGGGSAQR